MPTLRAAAELLSVANCLDNLEPIAVSIGCKDALPLDPTTLRSLGIESLVDSARIARGHGAIRALLATVDGDAELRAVLPRMAARLSARAPHVLWIAIVAQPRRHEVAIASWTDDRRPPRVRALLATSSRVIDSDAETLRALCAAPAEHDILTHARWVEILGRESLTARFYRGLERAVATITNSSRLGSDAARHELALIDTSRLLFLCFLEAKGWLDGDHAFLARRFESCSESGGRFHERVLRPLFFGTLNTPVRKRARAALEFGAIPFLNGGLFARTSVERRHHRLAFSDDAYGSLIFDLFSQYRFTIAEESAGWSEAAVDPEMLGRAFESLMLSRERQRTGAFFTPFSLVERVTDRALEGVLNGDRCLVERATVLDPACGSGAFLVHALERLAARRRELGDERNVAALRREVLTRSIFGVDTNPTAVWLCQLRLWLSVVLETDDRNPAAVLPLPNLDRNVRVGDALAGSAFGDSGSVTRGAGPLRRLRERYARATGPRKRSLARELDRAERARYLTVVDAELESIAKRRRDLITAQRGRDLFGDRYRPSRDERQASHELRSKSTSLRAARRRIAGGAALPFSWSVHFADVAARGGFQVIVGNPPWVRLHRIASDQRARFRRDFAVARDAAWNAGATPSGAGSGFASQVDLAALFVERSVRLASPQGTIALLVPAKLWRSLAGGGVRRLLMSSTRIKCVEDFSDAPSVFDAAVYPSLVVSRMASRESPVAVNVGVSVHHRGREVAWKSAYGSLAFDQTPGAPWLLLPPDARHAFDRLRQAGRPMAQSAIGRPVLGVKCGLNDAFIVQLADIRVDVAHVIAFDGTQLSIERSLIRPLLRGERLRPWHSPDGQESILWTHDASGSALATLPPLAAAWLRKWRHELADRTDARHSGRWWSLFRTEAARTDRPRVVWADVGREPRASVLDAGDRRVPLNTCYVVRCSDVRDAHALAALLNSPLARAWLDAIAEPARGGYRRYLGWTVSLLPIPLDWHRARERLAPLSIAGCLGAPPSDVDLLDAAVSAYGVRVDDVAPLVAWMSP